MSLTFMSSSSPSDRNNQFLVSNEGTLLSEKTFAHRFCTYLVLFCFYFQTLWPTVSFAASLEVMRPVSPVSPTRFFYSPSQPEPRTMVLDLGVFIDNEDKAFDIPIRKQTLTVSFTEFADEIQDLITQSVAIQSLYPGLKSSEQGYSWIHYGYSFFLENNGHLQVKPKAGAEFQSAGHKSLRLYNAHGSITIEGRVPSHLRVKGQQVLFKNCQGTLKELSVWATGVGKATGSEGAVVIDYTSLLAVKKATIHQGTLHNAGTLAVADGGVLEAKERTLLNYGTLEMGDRTHLKAKEVTNHRVQKDPSSALVVGHITGKGTTTVDIGTFRNFGAVQIPTLQGRIQHLANTGHFEALKNFNNLIVLDFLNDVGGRILGQGALTLKGVNKGLIQGKSITFTLDGDFINADLATIRAEDGLNTQGSGSFLQRGSLETKRLSIDNARFENFASILQDQMSVIIGSNVAYWRNHEGGKLNTKQLVVNRSSLASSQLLNEGGIETGVFKNDASSFINSGPMLLGRWDQSGAAFKNQFGGEIRVALFSALMDTLDNAGDIHFDAEVLGEIAHTLNSGGLFFDGKTTLQGIDILNKKLMRAKAGQKFKWSGHTIENLMDLYLGNVTVRDRFDNAKTGSAQTAHLVLGESAELNNKGILCITEDLTGKDIDSFNSPGTLVVQGKTTLQGTSLTTTKESVLSLKGGADLTFTDPCLFLGTTQIEGDCGLKAPEIIVKGTLTHNDGKVTVAGHFIHEGKTLFEKDTLEASDVCIRPGGQLTLGEGKHLITRFSNEKGILQVKPKMTLSVVTNTGYRDGAIESERGLRILSLEAGQKAQSPDGDMPTINLLNPPHRTAYNFLSSREDVSVKGDIIVEFPSHYDVARFWDTLSGWKQTGILSLYGDAFKQTENYTRGGALKLFVNLCQNKKYKLIANALDIVADEFDTGTDNDLMALIQTVADPKIKGPQDNHLTITKKGRGNLDLGYTNVAGYGETSLTALRGDVLIGNYRLPSAGPGWYEATTPNKRVFTLINNGPGACLASFIPLPCSMNVTWTGEGHITNINSEQAYFDAFEPFQRVRNSSFVTSPQRITLNAPNGDVIVNYGIVNSLSAIEAKAKNEVDLIGAASLQAPEVTLFGKHFKQRIDGLGCFPFQRETAFFAMSGRPAIEANRLGLMFETYDTYGNKIIARESLSYLGKDGREITLNRPDDKVWPDIFKELSADCYFYCRGPDSAPDVTNAVGNLVHDHDRLDRLLETPWLDESKAHFYPVNRLQSHNFALIPIRQSGTTLTTAAKELFSQAYLSAGIVKMFGDQIWLIGSSGAQQGNQARSGIHSTYPGIQDKIRNNGIYRHQPDGTVRSPYLPGKTFKCRAVWGQSTLGVNPTYRIHAEDTLAKSVLTQLMALHMGRIYDEGRYGDALTDHITSYSEQHALLGSFTNEERLRQNVSGIAFFYKEVIVNGQPIAVLHIHLPESKINSDAGLSGIDAIDVGILATRNVAMVRTRAKAQRDLEVTADTGSITSQASKKTAGRYATFDAAENILKESLAFRIADGENYQDYAEIDHTSAGDRLVMKTQNGDIGFKGAQIRSGVGGSHIDSGRAVLEDTLVLGSQTVHRYKRGYSRDTYANHLTCDHQSAGPIVQTAQTTQELYAPSYKAQKVTLIGKRGVHFYQVHNTHDHESVSRTKGGGVLGKKKTTQTKSFKATSLGAEIDSIEPVEITAGEEGMTLTNVTFMTSKAILKALKGKVRFLLGTNYASYMRVSKSSSAYWESVSQRIEEHKTHVSPLYTCPFEIHSEETIVQSVQGHPVTGGGTSFLGNCLGSQVQGQIPSILELIDQHGGQITQTFVQDFHRIESFSAGGPTAALTAVIALAVTIATAGTGSWLGGAVVSATGATGTTALVISAAMSAACTTLCSQAAVAIVANKGDIGKAAESLAKSGTLKNIVMAAATAGLTKGLGQALGVDTAGKTFVDHLGREALKAGVGASLSMATGEDVENALGHAARGMVASSVGASLANEIGLNVSNFVVKELFHGASGATMGWMLSGTAKGAIGAGIAAIASTSFASLTQGDLNAVGERAVAKARAEGSLADGRPLDRESLSPYVQAELQNTVDLSRFAGAVATFLSGHDVGIGIEVATTAVVHNCAATMERQVFESSAMKEVIGQVAEVVSGMFEGDKEAAAALEKERQTFVENKLKQAESVKGRSLSPTSRDRAEALFNEQFYEYAEYRGQLPFYGAFIPGIEAADGCARGTKTTGQAIGETAFDLGLSCGVALGLKKVWQGGRWVVQKGAQVAEKRAAEMALRKAPKVVAPEAVHTKIPLPHDRPLTSEHYSTAFRVKLEEGVHYPGKGDSIHFREANKQLYEKLTLNKGFATQMETLYPGITKAVAPGPRGGIRQTALSEFGLTWHHSAHVPGNLELIPYLHHKSKGAVQKNLHPQGKGGQALWGEGRK